MNLTKAQRDVLQKMADGAYLTQYGEFVLEKAFGCGKQVNCRLANSLISKSLVANSPELYSNVFELTDKGRAALAEQTKVKE